MIREVEHPLLLHKLSLLRDKRVKPKQFRDLVHEITLILSVKATSKLDLTFTKMVFKCFNLSLIRHLLHLKEFN